jgi:GNAT superfamily N-acetyltransferase
MTLHIENYQNILSTYKNKKSLWNAEIFPYSQKYIENSKFRNCDWDSFYDDDCDLPIALTILKDDDEMRDTLHISLLEVAVPIRGLGYGLKVLNTIINLANTNGYKYITLHMAEPGLYNFYKKVGFTYAGDNDDLILEL